jgi:hypothetical protein
MTRTDADRIGTARRLGDPGILYFHHHGIPGEHEPFLDIDLQRVNSIVASIWLRGHQITDAMRALAGEDDHAEAVSRVATIIRELGITRDELEAEQVFQVLAE